MDGPSLTRSNAWPLAAQAIGRWCRLQVTIADGTRAPILFATFLDRGGLPIFGRAPLRRFRAATAALGAGYRQVCFIPDTAVSLRVATRDAPGSGIAIDAMRADTLATWQVAAHLLAARPRALRGLAARPLPHRPATLRTRFRHVLEESRLGLYEVGQDYATWISLFDRWRPEDFAPSAALPTIACLVLHQAASSAALRATLDSIAAQYRPPRHALAQAETLAAAAQGLDADYIAVLQAGEVLPPHATALAARELDRLGHPPIAITDDDDIAADGSRRAPRFKPQPNDPLMLSGALLRGLWLVRRNALTPALTSPTGWAETLRLRAWLTRRDRALAGAARIPFILCHRRPDTETAPPALLQPLVAPALAHLDPAIEVRPTWPLSFHLRAAPCPERVTVIVPSTLRRPHALRCITALAERTDYPTMELHVAVSQPEAPDAAQRAAAAAIEALPNARVTWLHAPSFNYSWVNNQIIGRTTGEHVLLVNDDVEPVRPDWLRWMVIFLRDPAAGVAGARLLYPSGTVQHGGVVMGLAGLCEHLHRDLPAGAPGYMGRAVLAQQMSAVTGACMLVRRRLLEQVGGLDEAYPSAFNDVDLALRIGALGRAVLYVPQAELIHHELQTYVSHYAGERAAFRDREADRLRASWAAVCADDPFHNPNLDLTPGRESQPAFPPRIGAPSG